MFFVVVLKELERSLGGKMVWRISGMGMGIISRQDNGQLSAHIGKGCWDRRRNMETLNMSDRLTSCDMSNSYMVYRGL